MIFNDKRAQVGMFKYINLSKRGQIGETMTWIVATIIIVVVLGISILLSTSISNSKENYQFDKEKDFLATKSITNFLSEEKNLQILENSQNEIQSKKIENFLLTLPVKSITFPINSEGAWSLEIDKGDSSKTIKPNLALGILPDFFEFKTNKDNLKLTFWAECPATCK